MWISYEPRLLLYIQIYVWVDFLNDIAIDCHLSIHSVGLTYQCSCDYREVPLELSDSEKKFSKISGLHKYVAINLIHQPC